MFSPGPVAGDASAGLAAGHWDANLEGSQEAVHDCRSAWDRGFPSARPGSERQASVAQDARERRQSHLLQDASQKAACRMVLQGVPREGPLALLKVEHDESGLPQAQSLQAPRASLRAALRQVSEPVPCVQREL